MDPDNNTPAALETPYQDKPRLRAEQSADGTWQYRTADSFENFLTSTGIQTNNISAGGHARINPVTRNRMQLEWLYRGNWVARTIIDAPSEDMTREGVELTADELKPEEIEAIEKQAETLQCWVKLGRANKWGDLYGGALAYMVIDGQDPSTPLDLDKVGKDQFKGIIVFDRWMAWPSTANIDKDQTSLNFGEPLYYNIWPDVGTGLPTLKIHHSRCIKFTGGEIPYWQRIAENYWGLSVLEPLWDRIMAFDSVTQGAAQLVYKAHLRHIRVNNLRAILGTNDNAAKALQKYFDLIRVMQSNEGLTLLDKNDEFVVNTYTFTGLADMMIQFAQQLGGGAQIPMVRFFAQSPAGMNATGESDWRNYYDGIKTRQERKLRAGIEVMYALLFRSVIGRKPKDAYTLKFRPLWLMSDEQAATVSSNVVTSVCALVDKQVYTISMALRELASLSGTTNFGGSITADQIAEAEKLEKEAAENPPMPGADDPNAMPGDDLDDNSSGNAGRRQQATSRGPARSVASQDAQGNADIRSAA